jgi:hypothetical protein
MKRRTQLALVAFGIFLSVAAPVIGYMALDDGKDVGQNVEFDKANGPRVTFGESVNITNENPWNKSNTIVLDPWGEFYSPGDTTVRVTQFNGTWTNTTDINATAANLTLRPNDKPELTVGGGVTGVNYRDDITLDDDQVALEYSAMVTQLIPAPRPAVARQHSPCHQPVTTKSYYSRIPRPKRPTSGHQTGRS